MKKFLAFLAPSLLVLVPVITFAQSVPAPKADVVTNYLSTFQTVIGNAIPFLIAISVLAILIGLARYAFSAGDENAQKQGRQIMVTGVIILFVMVALWGFVNILVQFFFGGGGTQAPDNLKDLVPDIPTNSAPGRSTTN